MRKNIKSIFICIIVLISISWVGIVVDGMYGNIYTIKLINTENENMTSSLSNQDIKIYKNKIESELSNELKKSMFKSRKNIKNSYYALGEIKSLQKDYKEANRDLLKAINYMDKKNNDIDFKIYKRLAINYVYMDDIDSFKNYFNEAKKIAMKENLTDELSNLYYSLSKINLRLKGTVCHSIDLMEKAIDLESTDNTKIAEYNFLAELYRSNGQFNLSLTYVMESLKISCKGKNYENMYKVIVNLGKIYYVQENYKKAAYVYESILKDTTYKSDDGNLSIIGYLMDSYFKLGENEKAENLKIEYESIANGLKKSEKNKELIWLYMVYSNVKLEQNDLELSKVYLDKSKTLYDENPLSVYSNSDLYLEKLEIGNRYESDPNVTYSETVEDYDKLLNKIKKRGIKSEIYITVLKDIINLSEKNKNYENTIKYSKLLEEYKKQSEDMESTDTILFKLQERIYKESQKGQNLKLLFSIILLGLISIITIVVIIKNSKINRLNKELEEISIKDPLTDIYNKRHFYSVLENITDNKKEITFIMIDIDYFKAFNDNYGHLKGDEVLKKVANILASTFSRDFVFRYGGEEFAIISEKSLKESLLLISILRDRLYKENIIHEFSEASDRITLSIGIEHEKVTCKEDIEKIIINADERLYKSKINGRNRYTCF